MAGRLLGAVAVHHQHAAVPGRGAQHDVTRDAIVRRKQRSGEATATETQQFHGFVAICIGQYACYRAERFDPVNGRSR